MLKEMMSHISTSLFLYGVFTNKEKGYQIKVVT